MTAIAAWYSSLLSSLPPIGTPQQFITPINSSGSPVTATTSANILNGDLLIVYVGMWTSGGRTVTAVSDGTNNYTKAQSATSSGYSSEIWYKAGASAVSSGATLSVTFSGATSGVMVSAIRVSGILLSSPLDAAPAGATGSGTSLSISSGVLAQPKEILVGATTLNSNPTFTQSAGFTSVGSTLFNAGIATSASFAYQIVQSTSSVSYAPSWSSSQPYAGTLVSFKGF